MTRAMLGSGGLTAELGIELFRAPTAAKNDMVLSAPPSGRMGGATAVGQTFHLQTEASWTLRVVPLGGSWAADSVLVPVVALVMGLCGSLVLALFIASLGYARALALRKVKTATQSLRHSQEQFSSLAASSPLGILQMSPDGQVTYANSRMTDITGRPFEELSGRGWLEALATRWSGTPPWPPLPARTKKPSTSRFRLRRGDGEVRRARLFGPHRVRDKRDERLGRQCPRRDRRGWRPRRPGLPGPARPSHRPPQPGAVRRSGGPKPGQPGRGRARSPCCCWTWTTSRS